MRLWIVGSVLWSLIGLFLAAVALVANDGVAAILENILYVPLWLTPCLFFLALGRAIGWVHQGFMLNQRSRPPQSGDGVGQPGGQLRGSGSAVGTVVSIVRRLFFF